jgi:hypothetical protein
MSASGNPRVVFSERLPDGIMVHFADGLSVFFPIEFLLEHRESYATRVFRDELPWPAE